MYVYLVVVYRVMFPNRMFTFVVGWHCIVLLAAARWTLVNFWTMRISVGCRRATGDFVKVKFYPDWASSMFKMGPFVLFILSNLLPAWRVSHRFKFAVFSNKRVPPTLLRRFASLHWRIDRILILAGTDNSFHVKPLRCIRFRDNPILRILEDRLQAE